VASSGALTLTDEEQAIAGGDQGRGPAFAMKIVGKLAEALAARSLVQVASVHVDGCLFHGRAGLDFAEKLVALGARVRVPTTLNVGSLDLLHPDLVHLNRPLREQALELMRAYEALGAAPTWTCAPYQDPGHRPRFGQHVAWAESNAIVFVNSVLGARTDRYGDFLDICAAVTGRAPFCGLHVSANRRGRVLFDCSQLPRSTLELDAAWAALGHFVGRSAGTNVPVLSGLPADAGEDSLKALGAAAASSGGVALFHAVGITPEAPTLEEAFHGDVPEATRTVTAASLRLARDELGTVGAGRIDAVSLGTPHFSVTEFAALARLLDGGSGFHPDVEVWISTSRHVLAEAERLGYLQMCRDAGARILVDTCTYVTRALGDTVQVVMTNSGKWAWYAPANLGIQVVFGSLADCVESARVGRVTRDEARWS
jgi:predicted aconitase